MGKNGMPFSCRIPLINTIICYKKTQQQPKKRKVRKNQGATCSGTRGHFPRTEVLRDHLIELISVRNLRHRPEALFALFRQFLQRLTLPRICHFLDLVLPQLTPVRAPWADATRTLWTCHHIRATAHENGHPYEPRVTIAYFFTSHDHIHHVRILWGTLPLLLFSDPRMVYPVNVYDFQGQAVHRLHKQPIQLGLRKGMAVLVYYRVQGGPHANTVFQAVLIAHESAATRGKNTENRLWKRVVPSETEFAWLPPDIAWAFCSDALRRRSDCQYLAFHEAHMGLHGRAFQANIFIVDMVFLGDTRSAEELAVFTNMAPERLCLGCGLRVDEKFTPIFPGERGPLFAASVKLLQFALRVSSASAFAKELTEEEDALRQAIRPLVMNPDCHFLAVLTVLVQSILEGRTDCPISGVFGAGKTRAAAAMIAGLLVMDPTLKVMVVTKENAAAHAFAKHIESLQVPPSLEEKFGRLVGATELEKGPASQTKLDIVPGYRNTVVRTKQVIIGCGGGFHQECTQPYSPVARWMADVDVALNDEGQQYGNLDEASAIARIPRKGIVIWCGDPKQTPGGLRKSEEARVFRRKLMRRPIALRGDTTFLPPHTDQDRFDTAYEAFQDLANDLYYIDLRRYSRGSTSEDAAGVLLLDGYEKLQEMVHLPRTWPLARLTIPLEGLSKQTDRLLEGYCFQILATNRYPEAHNGRVLQTATHLG